ncbi:hypothetical protein BDY21DRAFT_380557 [Lineolata rhizophorae]|uniref:DUF7168 domain-containing protein n=1 Tax=Lineolata rhizophorae TaxID=578093 RepID=A0A6A6NVF6_9PEZI|nr:hypothetical protein BDY21DRAFT_380557 [Lineolata rhizophorae]
MGQYNITQAEVLAHETPSEHRNHGGQSTVAIQRVDGDQSKRVKHQNFVDMLCAAMRCFFDCKSYSTAYLSQLRLTFYGIAENTVAAAMAFEMAYNLIVEWARPHKGVGSKNSYCLGVSNGLATIATKEKADEEAKVQKAEADKIAAQEKEEEAQRLAQIDRLYDLTEISPSTRPTVEPGTSPDRHKDDIKPNLKMEGRDSSSGESDDDSSSEGSETELKIEKGECDDSSGDSENEASDDETDEGTSDEEGEDSWEPDFKVEEHEGDIDPYENFDEELRRMVKPEPELSEPTLGFDSPQPPPSVSPFDTFPQPVSPLDSTLARSQTEPTPNNPTEPERREVESRWASHMQLVIFRETANRIADQFLEDRGVKLNKSKSKVNVIRDSNAYLQGKEDSKKIDGEEGGG